MILVADSGSTKTEWGIIFSHCNDKGSKPSAVTFLTQGINPMHMDENTIRNILAEELLPKLNAAIQKRLSNTPLGHTIEEISFYGAGCNEHTHSKMYAAMRLFFPAAKISIGSDLIGAARALLGNKQGIACILGTGSNSCYYDGVQIVHNVLPLGYILGDEGSGAVLGKMFLNALFKGRLSDDIKKEFLDYHNTTYQEIIESVYRKPLPNRFLANISKFIYSHIDNRLIKEIVYEDFENFFCYNITQYVSYGAKDISAVGSIAFYYQDIFRAVAEKHGYEVVQILKSPIEGMIAYHSKPY